MGRPREFDVDQALGCALNLFWRKGYEGTSLTDLTEAMGITRPSLYAAFGNKEELFRKALDRYDAAHLGFIRAALNQPRARAVVEHLLYGYADAATETPYPAGCLSTQAALACSDASEPIRRELVTRRKASEAALAERLEAARVAVDLSADADPVALARYVMTLAQGMAVQATSGVGRRDLHGVVAAALANWPSA